MEIAINAMTPHALVQTPSQGRPLQYLDPPYQLYAAVIVLTRYHHWYDLGTKLLSLPLIPKQIQMVRRRQLKSFALERSRTRWLEHRLTPWWVFPQMFRDIFLNRSKGCMVPSMTSSLVCREAQFGEEEQALESILSRELLNWKNIWLHTKNYVCIWVSLREEIFYFCRRPWVPTEFLFLMQQLQSQTLCKDQKWPLPP